MFDFHSHILPGIDDGCRSIAESLELIRESFRQGITGIAATPHFYASVHTPASWFERRRKAFESLKPYLSDDMPKLRLGAELRYYEGIARSEEVLDFRLEGTKLLLLEMPECEWTPRMLGALAELSYRPGITLALAHTERYLPFQNVKVLKFLRESGILIQANAEFFLQRVTRKKALRMIKNGEIHLLGSDCHNIVTRGQRLKEAFDIIVKALGTEAAEMLTEREKLILNETE